MLVPSAFRAAPYPIAGTSRIVGYLCFLMSKESQSMILNVNGGSREALNRPTQNTCKALLP